MSDELFDGSEFLFIDGMWFVERGGQLCSARLTSGEHEGQSLLLAFSDLDLASRAAEKFGGEVITHESPEELLAILKKAQSFGCELIAVDYEGATSVRPISIQRAIERIK